VQQGDELQQQTLQTLRAGPFNKIRMCVFPKSYEYNHNEAPFYPFERDAAGKHDFARPNPALFAHLEQAAAGNNAKNSGLEAQPAAYYLNASSLDPSAKVTEEILYYMDFHQPIFYQFSLPDGEIHGRVNRSMGEEGDLAAGDIERGNETQAYRPALSSSALQANSIDSVHKRKRDSGLRTGCNKTAGAPSFAFLRRVGYHSFQPASLGAHRNLSLRFVVPIILVAEPNLDKFAEFLFSLLILFLHGWLRLQCSPCAVLLTRRGTQSADVCIPQ
jgi:hypothetical protein